MYDEQTGVEFIRAIYPIIVEQRPLSSHYPNDTWQAHVAEEGMTMRARDTSTSYNSSSTSPLEGPVNVFTICACLVLNRTIEGI